MRAALPLVFVGSLVAGTIAACSSSTSPTGSASGGDAGMSDVFIHPPPDASIKHPCDLPGAVRFTSTGTQTVPGGNPGWASLAFLHLPVGFCAHYFANVGDARRIRFAPGGELFVASPSAGTTGGASQMGEDAIILLPDDDLDGVADAPIAFLSFKRSSSFGTTTQGLLFAKGYFYYQDGNVPSSTPFGSRIMRMPYQVGQRQAVTPEVVADITYYNSLLHWPKSLDMADDGSIYVGNGGDQEEACVTPHPFHGGILKIDPAPGPNLGGIQVAKGFRNPISVRCRPGHNTCFAIELAKDYTVGQGGREKMVPIRVGDDWGFPCCATKDTPYQDAPTGTDCGGTAAETNSFLIGDTPFDLDFEPGRWPGMWAGRAYVVTHGTNSQWTGARMVAIPMDPSTGMPMPSSNTSGTDVGMVDFATGWDDNTQSHGRPASVTFSPDGRLFVADDNRGLIFWVAPID